MNISATRRHVTGLVVACVCAVGLAVPARAQQVRADDHLIEISGRVSPELIPDYLVWEQLFRILVRESLQPWPDAGIQSLSLSIGERHRLWAEAQASVAREAACEEQLITEFDALRSEGASPEEIARTTRELIVGCRLATLAAVDTLMGDLSESARFSLSAWAMDHRSGMTVVLLARDLAFFRTPR